MRSFFNRLFRCEYDPSSRVILLPPIFGQNHPRSSLGPKLWATWSSRAYASFSYLLRPSLQVERPECSSRCSCSGVSSTLECWSGNC